MGWAILKICALVSFWMIFNLNLIVSITWGHPGTWGQPKAPSICASLTGSTFALCKYLCILIWWDSVSTYCTAETASSWPEAHLTKDTAVSRLDLLLIRSSTSLLMPPPNSASSTTKTWTNPSHCQVCPMAMWLNKLPTLKTMWSLARLAHRSRGRESSQVNKNENMQHDRLHFGKLQ